ncbi:MAG: guanylate kinase [bacterium]|nr:guanylate kinase [bacterium]MDD5353984.1 guanylate kinase [bacterium]MDD5757163.1 guanylate kinase [bacterium]
MHQGKLIVLSGPSGTGKTTLCRELVKRIPGLVFSISATTRDKRPGERDAYDYYFLTPAEFKRKIKAGEFLEWAKVYSHYYGTIKKPITDNLAKGVSVLLDIDMQGALQVKNKFSQAVLIFILPPSLEELRQRLIRRKRDSLDTIARRMKQIEEEMKYIPQYDQVVTNKDLVNTVKCLQTIIKQRMKTE